MPAWGVGRGVWQAAAAWRRHALRPTPYALAALAAAAPLRAQSVVLQLRPEPGDTIRMRVDQETQIVGELRGASTATHLSTMTLRLWSRAIVQRRLPGATSVLTITDSVRLTTTDPHAKDVAARTARALAGRAMRLRLAHDGTARIEDANDRDLSAVVSAMPAAFPARAVAVGDHWRREMPLPRTHPLASADGVIRAVFRLDSLTQAGGRAWISVRGELSGEPSPAAGGRGEGDMDGTLAGVLVLDRRRGWLEDSRFELAVQTTVVVPSAPPMRVVTKIQQHMRVDPARPVSGRGARPGRRE